MGPPFMCGDDTVSVLVITRVHRNTWTYNGQQVFLLFPCNVQTPSNGRGIT